MHKSKKYDIFISYSRKDFQEVNDLLQKITQAIPTLNYWFDLNGIESGDDEFDERIITAIDNSSYVIFALSENSIASKWTKDEITYAKNIGKKVIPVLIKGAQLNDGWFLFKFGRVDCVDSTNDIQIEKLIKNLSKWTNNPIAKTNKTDNLQSQNSEDSISIQPQNIKNNYTKWPYLLITICLIVLSIVLLKKDLLYFNQISKQSSYKQEVIKYEWVDLGLSVMWATCNIGADNPEQSGHYFAWGEVFPKKHSSWENYKFGRTSNELIKYCSDCQYGKNGYTDRQSELLPHDDVATNNLGKHWRIPTSAEIEELMTMCSCKWTQINGVSGYLFEAKNGNSIFLPASGLYDGNHLQFSDIAGFYWTNTLNVEQPCYAYSLGFNETEIVCSDDSYRYISRSIRPVYEK